MDRRWKTRMNKLLDERAYKEDTRQRMARCRASLFMSMGSIRCFPQGCRGGLAVTPSISEEKIQENNHDFLPFRVPWLPGNSTELRVDTTTACACATRIRVQVCSFVSVHDRLDRRSVG